MVSDKHSDALDVLIGGKAHISNTQITKMTVFPVFN